MRKHWLAKVSQTITKTRDACQSRVINVLRPMAMIDSKVAEILDLMRLWASSPQQEGEHNTEGVIAGRIYTRDL